MEIRLWAQAFVLNSSESPFLGPAFSYLACSCNTLGDVVSQSAANQKDEREGGREKGREGEREGEREEEREGEREERKGR